MLPGLVIAEAGCCLAAAVLLARLWRPDAPAVSESFAGVMAALLPRRAPGVPGAAGEAVASMPSAPPPNAPGGASLEGAAEDAPRLIEGLALSKRMALLRHMLQGRSAGEAATQEQVDIAAVRALFRSHGRVEG